MFNKSIKILIIDDMMTMRKIVKKIMTEDGYTNTIEAGDGVIAWDLLATDKEIGLIISDWNMPNLTGLELLKKVRADEKLKHLPFVLLTAESDMAQVKQALDLGVDNYILKPFSADSIRSKLLATYNKTKHRASL